MVAVIFEAFPAKGKWEEYLDLAAGLRPELSKIEEEKEIQTPKRRDSISRFKAKTKPLLKSGFVAPVVRKLNAILNFSHPFYSADVN